ncbi:restriction endonuclease subunit S [Mycoplasmopsis columboralis]|uniref:restriction endonuclease subunit S n=1 Tax=Mycoplasmopsis columboralis TaxID=171282 RepID=UPI0005656B36|nr:restriction endonuclease subunit S [Mycoplasmopsis columboralis]
MEVLNPNKNKYWTVKELFKSQNGRIIPKTELSNNGKYPVYSAQVTNNGEMGRLNTYDFDGEYLSWTIHGYAGEIFYRKGKFSATNVCGILSQINKNIDIRFAYHYLKYIVPNFVFTKGSRQMFMTNEMYQIQIPNISLYKQKQIATILDAFEKYCSEVVGILPLKIQLIEQQYKYYLNKLLADCKR